MTTLYCILLSSEYMRVKGRINMAKYGVPRLLLGRSFALLGLSSSWQKHIHRFETPARCKRSLLSRLFVSTCPCAGCEGASTLRSRPRESHFVSKRQQRLEPSIYPRGGGGQGKASQSSSHGVRERGESMAWQHMAGFRWRLSLSPAIPWVVFVCVWWGGWSRISGRRRPVPHALSYSWLLVCYVVLFGGALLLQENDDADLKR